MRENVYIFCTPTIKTVQYRKNSEMYRKNSCTYKKKKQSKAVLRGLKNFLLKFKGSGINLEKRSEIFPKK